MDRPARTFVLPVPLSRMLAAYNLIKRPEWNIGTRIFIPVTNLLERLFVEERRRMKIIPNTWAKSRFSS